MDTTLESRRVPLANLARHKLRSVRPTKDRVKVTQSNRQLQSVSGATYPILARLGADILDIAIFLPLAIVEAAIAGERVIGRIVLVGLFAIYQIALTPSGTIGRRVFGVQVADVSTLRRLSRQRAGLRWLCVLTVTQVAVFLPGVFFWVPLVLLYSTAGLDERHRAVHDRVARTVVIRTRD